MRGLRTGDHRSDALPPLGAVGPVSRRAFTLLEIVIVLGLVVLVSALALNTLQKPVAARRLQLAADQIRADWARARNRAMASGQIYYFTCELGTGSYIIQPLTDSSLQGDIDQSLPPIAGSVSGNTGQGGARGAAGQTGGRQLPDRITFADLQLADGDLSATFSQNTTVFDPSVSLGGLLAPTSGGSSIYFFPDGSTSSALVTLENEFGRRIDVSLRGLTGAVLVSDSYNGGDGGVPVGGNAP